jgi:hypothetical protein
MRYPRRCSLNVQFDLLDPDLMHPQNLVVLSDAPYSKYASHGILDDICLRKWAEVPTGPDQKIKVYVPYAP